MLNKAQNDPNSDSNSGEVIILIGFCYKLPLNFNKWQLLWKYSGLNFINNKKTNCLF